MILLFVLPALLLFLAPDHELIPGDPPRYYAIAALPALVLLGAWWFFYRREALAVNRVAIAETGFYPPFKPRGRLSTVDWFVEYGDIVSMRTVRERTGVPPAFEFTLKDGLTFRVDPLDLLPYVGEKEVDRFATVLRRIQEELGHFVDRTGASRGGALAIRRTIVEEP